MGRPVLAREERSLMGLGPIMLLMPFGAGSAHIVQLGPIGIEQSLRQRIPHRGGPGGRRVGGLRHIPRLGHLWLPRHSRIVTARFKRSFEIQTLVYDRRMADRGPRWGKFPLAAGVGACAVVWEL